MQTIAQALHTAKQQLTSITTTPLLDAEVLLSFLLNVSRSDFYTHPERILTANEQAYFNALIGKRVHGQPIPYITGRCEFWSLDLWVTPDTLIPRPETELLVELALRELNKGAFSVADLGTGSGAIALALAHERPSWLIYATDSSAAALNVAKTNASRLEKANIRFYQGNWFEALPKTAFDMIVSNPPYIAEEDPHLQQSVLATEPHSALISGKDGLKDIQHIIHEARMYLKPGGRLLLEHGFLQSECVKSKFLEVGYAQVTSIKDLSGLNRVSMGVFGIE